MAESYPSNLAVDLDFVAHLTKDQRIRFVVRHARLALRLFNRLDFPVMLTERMAMEAAVNLTEDAAAAEVSAELLEIALHDIGRLADVALTRGQLRSERALGHVARAVYAAVRTTLTNLPEHALDVVDYTFEAIRSVGARDLEKLLIEDFRRFRTDVYSADTPQPRVGPMHPTERRDVSTIPSSVGGSPW